jgi:hypothetical protein
MPHSTFIEFRAHRIFSIGFQIAEPGVLTPTSVVMVSLTEIGSDGHPHLGDATMKIYNVSPGFGFLNIRGEIDWDDDLNIRANVFIA